MTGSLAIAIWDYNDAEKFENTGSCYAGDGGAARASVGKEVKAPGSLNH
jgi:hypothetical protein